MYIVMLQTRRPSTGRWNYYYVNEKGRIANGRAKAYHFQKLENAQAVARLLGRAPYEGKVLKV